MPEEGALPVLNPAPLTTPPPSGDDSLRPQNPIRPTRPTSSPSPRRGNKSPIPIGNAVDLKEVGLGDGWTVAEFDAGKKTLVVTKPDGDGVQKEIIPLALAEKAWNGRWNGKNQRTKTPKRFTEIATQNKRWDFEQGHLQVLNIDATGGNLLVDGFVNGKFIRQWVPMGDIDQLALTGKPSKTLFENIGVSVEEKKKETKKEEKKSEEKPEKSEEERDKEIIKENAREGSSESETKAKKEIQEEETVAKTTQGLETKKEKPPEPQKTVSQTIEALRSQEAQQIQESIKPQGSSTRSQTPTQIGIPTLSAGSIQSPSFSSQTTTPQIPTALPSISSAAIGGAQIPLPDTRGMNPQAAGLRIQMQPTLNALEQNLKRTQAKRAPIAAQLQDTAIKLNVAFQSRRSGIASPEIIAAGGAEAMIKKLEETRRTLLDQDRDLALQFSSQNLAKTQLEHDAHLLTKGEPTEGFVRIIGQHLQKADALLPQGTSTTEQPQEQQTQPFVDITPPPTGLPKKPTGVPGARPFQRTGEGFSGGKTGAGSPATRGAGPAGQKTGQIMRRPIAPLRSELQNAVSFNAGQARDRGQGMSRGPSEDAHTRAFQTEGGSDNPPINTVPETYGADESGTRSFKAKNDAIQNARRQFTGETRQEAGMDTSGEETEEGTPVQSGASAPSYASEEGASPDEQEAQQQFEEQARSQELMRAQYMQRQMQEQQNQNQQQAEAESKEAAEKNKKKSGLLSFLTGKNSRIAKVLPPPWGIVYRFKGCILGCGCLFSIVMALVLMAPIIGVYAKFHDFFKSFFSGT